MNTNNNRRKVKKMILKYLDGKTTVEENEFLDAYYHYLVKKDPLAEPLSASEQQNLKEEIEASVKDQIYNPNHHPTRLFTKKLLAAASIFIIISAGLYIGYKNYYPGNMMVVKRDIAPGGNKAVLIFANGSKVILDTAHMGLIARQGNVRIRKTNAGSVIYDPVITTGADQDVQAPAFNTIITPRGGEYHITLPDGSNVWLNASSTLKFPPVFSNQQRTVELTGEAYFEVAKNKAKPFIVKANGANIKVLGTHFNITAYADEPAVNTTLLEGSVEVSKGELRKIISPGQQAKVSDDIQVANVDAQQAIAWKEGYFVFKNENIKNIMQDISRWYNVDIDYQGNVAEKFFGGKVSRHRNISEIFKYLELTGSVHFKIEGRRITVMP